MADETINTVAVVGAGNGGKAVAADLALHGGEVRLFEWPEYRVNIEALLATPVIEAEGVVHGEAPLALVTTDLSAAIAGTDLIMACVQGLAHERLAGELAPLMRNGTTILLNPGSTGGSLEFRRIFGECGVTADVLLAETSTLTHCARTTGARGVHIGLRVKHIAFAALPGSETDGLLRSLQRVFPGLKPKADVLEVGLCNGNPVIHPAIMLGNIGAIERLGSDHHFYSEGVTPTVAKLVEAVDRERIALGKALGYDLMTEPEMSLAQGYSTTASYHDCYAGSPVFKGLRSPDGIGHRYLHEDVGLGLVTYISLGQMLGVETPASRALVTLASIATGRGYMTEGRRTIEKLGLAGLGEQEREALLRHSR
jgi:opine dehydrogenase